MAISKKGMRKITVQGNTYFWRERCKPRQQQHGYQESSVVIADAQTEGTLLVVNVMRRLVPGFGYINIPEPVLPSDVEKYILEALRRGWKPAEKGKPFTIKI